MNMSLMCSVDKTERETLRSETTRETGISTRETGVKTTSTKDTVGGNLVLKSSPISISEVKVINNKYFGETAGAGVAANSVNCEEDYEYGYFFSE